MILFYSISYFQAGLLQRTEFFRNENIFFLQLWICFGD